MWNLVVFCVHLTRSPTLSLSLNINTTASSCGLLYDANIFRALPFNLRVFWCKRQTCINKIGGGGAENAGPGECRTCNNEFHIYARVIDISTRPQYIVGTVCLAALKNTWNTYGSCTRLD